MASRSSSVHVPAWDDDVDPVEIAQGRGLQPQRQAFDEDLRLRLALERVPEGDAAHGYTGRKTRPPEARGAGAQRSHDGHSRPPAHAASKGSFAGRRAQAVSARTNSRAFTAACP